MNLIFFHIIVGSLVNKGILFGQQGKIKRIKMYHTEDGKAKGDALITFHRPEVAAATCIKFNGLDIGDGCIIKVERADFKAGGGNAVRVEGPIENNRSRSNIDTTTAYFVADSANYTSSHDFTPTSSGIMGNIATHNARTVLQYRSYDDRSLVSGDSSLFALSLLLPDESALHKHPVVLIDNAFDCTKALEDEEYCTAVEVRVPWYRRE